jgi:hypothetical protein
VSLRGIRLPRCLPADKLTSAVVPIASFRCAAEFDRNRSITDIDQDVACRHARCRQRPRSGRLRKPIRPSGLSKYSVEVRRRRKSFDDDGCYAEKIPSSVRYEPLSRTVFCELDRVPNTCSASSGKSVRPLSIPARSPSSPRREIRVRAKSKLASRFNMVYSSSPLAKNISFLFFRNM